MQLEDIQAVYELSKVSFSVPWSLESLAKELTNPVAQYEVAEMGEEIVGYSGLWCVMDEGEITHIAVNPRYRKQGIGQALLESLLTSAVKNGLTIIHLEVRASNVAAQRLYEKLGFKKMSIRKNYYQQPSEDAVIMINQL